MALVVDIEHLRKRYKNTEAVRDVSFSVARGEIFGIVGPNGAGKTTTMEIMEGLRKRDSGKVEILGLDPNYHPYELRERIGVQFQTTSIQERMKVGEAIRLFSAFYKTQTDGQRVIELLGLQSRLHQTFRDLSGGWKQRLTLALAVIHNPELVFLDEPSTGLDPQARRELWDLILKLREDGKTIVLTTHYMEEAERLCDRVAMFNHGEIAALDSPRRLVAQLAAANYMSFESEEADIAAIEQLPTVERVEQTYTTFKVYSLDLQDTALQLLQAAKKYGWRLAALRFEVGTLDDLFVQMTKQEIRQ